MHQSVVEHAATPGAKTALAFALAGRGAPRHWFRELPLDTAATAKVQLPAPEQLPRGGVARFSSYIAAAVIAAGLLAAWAGLCVI